MNYLKMKIEDFIAYLKSENGLKESIEFWNKIKTNLTKNRPLYLEWVVWRVLLYATGQKEDFRVITNIKLNEDCSPKRCAPPNIPDLVLIEKTKGLVFEVTERPIPGKVEHFSHIDWANTKYSTDFIGILIIKEDLEKVPLEVWNTYKSYQESGKGLFMIMDVEFLIKLVIRFRQNSLEKLTYFIDNSKSIWSATKSWKEVRERIIKLENILING